MNKLSNNEFGILILSCDAYLDLWPLFLEYFFNNFDLDGTSYPVYFGSNEVPNNDPRVIPLLSGKDTNWSSSYIKILEQISCSKILVILEDMIVVTPVEAYKLKEFVEFGISSNATHVQYSHWPWHNNLTSKNNLFLEIPKQMPYRSLVCGFWDKSYLTRLLIPGESPWNFEIMGSYRVSYDTGFYVIKKNLFDWVNLVEKGCWTNESLIWAKKNSVNINLFPRPISKFSSRIISKLKKYYFNSVRLLISWKFRVKFMHLLRKIFISY
ncbi:hypothetical protein K6112_04540 [Methylophilales bacterium]|nr:hypothetical protein K6112_04540 [Methylophilales bacterium]